MNGWFTSTRMSRSILVRTLSRTEGTQQKQQHSNQCMNNTDPAKRLCCLKESLLSSFDLFLNVPVSHRTPFRQWNSGLFLACPNFLLCFIIFPAHSHTAFKKKSPVHIPNFWILSVLNIKYFSDYFFPFNSNTVDSHPFKCLLEAKTLN